jgi:hypothetical protein
VSDTLRRNDVIETYEATAAQLAIGRNRDNTGVMPILTFWDEQDKRIISVAITADLAASLARDLADCAEHLMRTN